MGKNLSIIKLGPSVQVKVTYKVSGRHRLQHSRLKVLLLQDLLQILSVVLVDFSSLQAV